MQALIALTTANIKSYLRDRAALFWTLAFPLIFIFMFGFIFQGGGSGGSLTIAWADADAGFESGQLRDAFFAQETIELEETTEEDALARMRAGEVDAVIVVPAGYGETVAAGGSGRAGDHPRCTPIHRARPWPGPSTRRSGPCSGS